MAAYSVILHLKPRKIQLLTGIASFDISSILDTEKYSKWIYEEPIIYDPTQQFSNYHNERREQMRKTRAYNNFENFKINNFKIKSDIDERIMEKSDLNEANIVCNMSEECEIVRVSFILEVILSEGIEKLMKNFFKIPSEWIVQTDQFPTNDLILNEEHYQEIISRKEQLIGFGYSITNKDLFLKVMSPTLYEKYALLRE